jgi:hypothetical protein
MGARGPDIDVAALLATLTRDPFMRLPGVGRLLLGCMSMSRDMMSARQNTVDAVPDHCVVVVAKLARRYAGMWTELAIGLERRRSPAPRRVV